MNIVKVFKTALLSIVVSMSVHLGTAQAGPQPFIGEISWVPYNFAPDGWAFCDGQLLNIADNQALFSLLGNTFGGDGRATFALPDVRSRVILHSTDEPNSTERTLGETGGSESEQISINGLFMSEDAILHNHTSNRVRGKKGHRHKIPMETIAKPFVTGGNGSTVTVSHMQPYIVLNCIIALEGVYPPRD